MAYAPTAVSIPKPSNRLLTERELIDIEVAAAAKRYGVSEYQMHRTIYCESHYKNIQSRIVKYGVQEDSHGIVQIHLPSHPNITREQAYDISFSVDFLAKEIAAGNSWKWYGYNPKSDRCNVI